MDELFHAVQSMVNHFTGPDRVERTIRVLKRLCVRVDKYRPSEVLAGLVDRSGRGFASTLLTELVEGCPQGIEMLSEWVSWNTVKRAQTVALTLTESHFLDSERLGNAG